MLRKIIGKTASWLRRIRSQLLTQHHYSRLAPKAWQSSSLEYEKYLHTQLRRTLSKKDASLPKRAQVLIDKVAEFIDLTQCDVLCVGSRNTAEIDYFRSKDIKSVVGIDLYSEDEAILVMDMHDMIFPDESFDIIYSSHSLEHSFDVQQSVREIVRVARPGAILAIEVPVEYETRGADLVDFGNLDTLHRSFEPHIAQVLWSEKCPPHSPANNSGHSVIRTVFRIVKE